MASNDSQEFRSTKYPELQDEMIHHIAKRRERRKARGTDKCHFCGEYANVSCYRCKKPVCTAHQYHPFWLAEWVQKTYCTSCRNRTILLFAPCLCLGAIFLIIYVMVTLLGVV